MKYKKYFNFACTVDAKEVQDLLDIATELDIVAPNFEIILLCKLNNNSATINIYTKLESSNKITYHYRCETVVNNENELKQACQNTVKMALSKLNWRDVIEELIDEFDALDLLDDLSLDDINNGIGFGEVSKGNFNKPSNTLIDF